MTTLMWLPCCTALRFFFFFSSRRRHTRFDCDWSSDVCSSDLSTCSKHSPTSMTRRPPWFRRVTRRDSCWRASRRSWAGACFPNRNRNECDHHRSEEHTSELQSQSNLVCRLLLEKKKKEST